MALGSRALAVVRGLPDHSLIDRLIRGRAWIPVLGVLLVGIVAAQVEILKLGSSMGQAVERSARLQTQNESLRASVAALADDQRIERLAAGMGMAMPTPDSLVFITAHPGGGLGKALANIHTPDPTGFMSQLAAQAAAAAALMPPAPPSTATTTATTTTPAAAAPAVGTSAGGTSASPTSTAATTTTTTTPTTTAASSAGSAAAPPASGAAPATGTPSAGGAATTGAAGIAPSGSTQASGG